MRIIVEQLSGEQEGDPAPRMAVVLPAYNEQENVAHVVEGALAAGAALVVGVNDCSTDRTGRILDELSDGGAVLAVHHERNQGKQASVKHGLAAALSRGRAKVFAVLDADMQIAPSVLPGLCSHVDGYDMVIGRRAEGEMPAVRTLANRLANLPYQVLAAVRVHDVQSGCRLYSRAAARYLAQHLEERGGYALEHTSMLILQRFARQRGRALKVAEIEVPFTYAGAVSSIRPIDNLQLTWSAVYHAAALAGWTGSKVA